MSLTLGQAWLLLLVGSFLILGTESIIDYSQPIEPDVYSGVAAEGFSTNYFKTNPIMKKYKDQNIDDVYTAGFRNLRLRCDSGLYDYPYDSASFEAFLDGLELVVDKCLQVGVCPIISWIHHQAEAYATEEDLENYIIWWKKVAYRLRNKDYRLSFNLFTELDIDVCQHTNNCELSLKENSTKYNIWTSQVVNAIRGTLGKNKKRILILGSPRKTAKGLYLIDESIYSNDKFMMVEHHRYASGPTANRPDSIKYWTGDGTPEQRQTLLDELALAKKDVPLKTYFGAWMPQDNKQGSLNQYEVESFTHYFCSVLKEQNIPWSANVLDVYYDTKKTTWITDVRDVKGASLNMSRVLDVMKEYL